MGIAFTGEQVEAEPVVVEVLEPTGDATTDLTDPVDRRSTAVAGLLSIEVG